jgi:hypothetical protein
MVRRRILLLLALLIGLPLLAQIPRVVQMRERVKTDIKWEEATKTWDRYPSAWEDM